ncbi:6342_t:CDS:2 [Gigaspora margarita]|uniref:6342_t:CDS:1 n=1 Tax=Gigaspora margarita TaxID=4874 RepID=A0ABN7V945_GIGMA|nr:6342_t:CDS:2 [Gigaspora margarita]
MKATSRNPPKRQTNNCENPEITLKLTTNLPNNGSSTNDDFTNYDSTSDNLTNYDSTSDDLTNYDSTSDDLTNYNSTSDNFTNYNTTSDDLTNYDSTTTTSRMLTPIGIPGMPEYLNRVG